MHILFYLKTDKRSPQPIVYVRLTGSNERVEFSLGLRMTNEQFRSVEYQDYFNEVQRKLIAIQTELIRSGTCTPTLLKEAYLNEQKRITYTLKDVLSEYLDKVKSEIGKEVTYETWRLYRQTKDKVLLYLQSKNLSTIACSSVDHRFIQDLQMTFKKSLNHNTAVKHVSRFRTIMYYALVKGYCTTNPFLGTKLKFKKTHRQVLNESELLAMYHKRITNDRLDKVRNIFLIQALTGMSYADIAKFTHSQIYDNVITLHRQKSGEPSYIPILRVTRELMERYNYQLPIISNQHMNEYLKEIATLCDISIELTTHIARHTFACLMLNNGMPIEVLQKVLGHANIRTTQIYAKMAVAPIKSSMLKVEKQLRLGKSLK